MEYLHYNLAFRRLRADLKCKKQKKIVNVLVPGSNGRLLLKWAELWSLLFKVNLGEQLKTVYRQWDRCKVEFTKIGSSVDCRSIRRSWCSNDTLSTSRSISRSTVGPQSTNFRSMHMSCWTLGRLSTYSCSHVPIKCPRLSIRKFIEDRVDWHWTADAFSTRDLENVNSLADVMGSCL